MQLGSLQQKPKLIRLLCDVSGSMYRFNGQDGRLDRQLETILMVMEAFESYEHKIKVCKFLSVKYKTVLQLQFVAIVAATVLY